jgi:hypothetical protein
MNKIKVTGVALAIGAASMFAFAPAFAADEATTTTTMVKCNGGNACKGQSACKTATNSCKGQNSCKGKGMTSVSSKEECEKAGGTVAE